MSLKRWHVYAVIFLGAAFSASCAVPEKAVTHAQTQTQSIATPISPQTYAFIGTGGEVTAQNLGRIGNAGFIVGEQGVLVIDSGVSFAHGKLLHEAVAQITNKPIVAVLITHAMQEFLFGATAFQQQGAKIWMHADAMNLMRQRCENCLKNLFNTLGDAQMRGTTLPKPDVIVTDAASAGAELSRLIGRHIELLQYGHSSSPGDIAVYDVTSQTLFAGGLIESRRVPDTRDAKVTEWIKALDAVASLQPRHIVAAHGPLSNASSIAATRQYLVALESAVGKLVNEGVGLLEGSGSAKLDTYRNWDQYQHTHAANVQRSYLEQERKLFDVPNK